MLCYVIYVALFSKFNLTLFNVYLILRHLQIVCLISLICDAGIGNKDGDNFIAAYKVQIHFL